MWCGVRPGLRSGSAPKPEKNWESNSSRRTPGRDWFSAAMLNAATLRCGNASLPQLSPVQLRCNCPSASAHVIADLPQGAASPPRTFFGQALSYASQRIENFGPLVEVFGRALPQLFKFFRILGSQHHQACGSQCYRRGTAAGEQQEGRCAQRPKNQDPFPILHEILLTMRLHALD